MNEEKLKMNKSFDFNYFIKSLRFELNISKKYIFFRVIVRTSTFQRLYKFLL